MQSVGPDQARFEQDTQLQQTFAVDRSQQLWEFNTRHTVSGVPVNSQDTNIAIQKAQQLQQAFEPNVQLQVWTGYISPAQEDKQSLNKYTAIKRAESQRKAYIVSQDKQFCPTLNKFLILLVYCNVQMSLNPRYDFLRIK